MSYFFFEGTDSRELGLMITRPVVRPSWARDVSETERPGAASRLMQQSRSYMNAEFSIQTVIEDASPENVRRIFQTINGFGRLIISTAPDEYLNVYVQPLVPEAVALLMAELTINVTALPFAYAVSPTTADLTSASDYAEVENPGSIWSEPEIRFKGSGDVTVTVNGADFILKLTSELAGKEIIIDCAAQVAYYLDGDSKRSINQLTYNDFPLLHTGKNYIKHSGSVSEMSINVRERWL